MSEFVSSRRWRKPEVMKPLLARALFLRSLPQIDHPKNAADFAATTNNNASSHERSDKRVVPTKQIMICKFKGFRCFRRVVARR